mmetsp:Transcript_4068/g.9413  ORF Transcript_4068/g.9413 Transcript_4068/m.9413 type:complete len:201 (+) Transcript_4068:4568-5170(+)
MMGNSLAPEICLMRRAVSIPFIPGGILMSQITISIRSEFPLSANEVLTSSTALSPDDASETIQPMLTRNVRKRRRMVGASSTTRTCEAPAGAGTSAGIPLAVASKGVLGASGLKRSSPQICTTMSLRAFFLSGLGRNSLKPSDRHFSSVSLSASAVTAHIFKGVELCFCSHSLIILTHWKPSQRGICRSIRQRSNDFLPR